MKKIIVSSLVIIGLAVAGNSAFAAMGSRGSVGAGIGSTGMGSANIGSAQARSMCSANVGTTGTGSASMGTTGNYNQSKQMGSNGISPRTISPRTGF